MDNSMLERLENKFLTSSDNQNIWKLTYLGELQKMDAKTVYFHELQEISIPMKHDHLKKYLQKKRISEKKILVNRPYMNDIFTYEFD